MSLSDAQGEALLGVARTSIEHGLDQGVPLPVRADDWPAALRGPAATFVTLERHGRLRGCRGVLAAIRPLVEDVAVNAFDTAFADPRFAPLRRSELDDLAISLSVLSAPENLPVDSLQALVATLRPGVDGLIIDDGSHRATFLPAVWTQLPDPADFVAHLWDKAGLPPGAWPASLQVQRYRAQKIEAPAA